MSDQAMTATLDRLSNGCRHMGVSMTEDALAKLDRYLDAIMRWNAVHNLTAIREKALMVTHHLFDSLAVVPYLPQAIQLLDVGTGAGLPGIPLAIARPDLEVTLVESNQKKTAFLRHIVTELALANITVAPGRAESMTAPPYYNIVISRAFADLATFVSTVSRLLKSDGLLYAMKGQYPADELSKLPPNVHLHRAMSLQIPELDAARHLIILECT